MLFAPAISDEFDPTNSHLKEQRINLFREKAIHRYIKALDEGGSVSEI